MYNKKKEKKENKVTSRYMLISPGAMHTVLVEFLAHCSGLPGFVLDVPALHATCSVWWCAGDGPVPQTG